MTENACVHCGSALTMARLVRVKEEGYEYACESCAVGERPGPKL